MLTNANEMPATGAVETAARAAKSAAGVEMTANADEIPVNSTNMSLAHGIMLSALAGMLPART